MGCRQGIVISGRFLNKQITQSEIVILKTTTLLTALAGRKIQTLIMLSAAHMDYSNDKVIFYIMEPIKCPKSTRSNQPIFSREYVEDEPLCTVKFVYLYLTHKSANITQNVSKIFISYDKQHQPASKRFTSSVIQRSNGDFSYGHSNLQAT